MHLHRLLAEVEGHIRVVHEVVGEVLLDHVALVAQADDEVVKAVMTVVLHDVPQNGVLADLGHRLGLHLGLFRQARAQPAGEYDDLHAASSLSFPFAVSAT